MSELLKVENLKVSFHTYAGEVQAVRGVSFEVNKGEVLAIVGESGCGKSVTSKSILGLLPKNNSEVKKDSKIIFDGHDILKYSNRELEAFRGREAGIIFQDPMTSLNPTMKVGAQIVESLLKHTDIPKADAVESARQLLRSVGIPNVEERINQYPHQFSGGMRQRVMIAIALACNPKLLIADEPTTALDVTIQAQILDLLKEIQKKSGTSIILITHDLGVVADIAHKVAVMYAGEIVEKGTVEEIYFNPTHPYTVALLNAVPGLDIDNKAPLVSIPGTPPDLVKPPTGCGFSSRCKYAMNICKRMAPEQTQITETHFCRCWLLHEKSPKVNYREGGL